MFKKLNSRGITINQTDNKLHKHIQSAEVVLPCCDLGETLTFYTDTLGFKVELIFPADNPQVAVLSGYGVRLRLEIGKTTAAGILRLLCNNVKEINNREPEVIAPNGVTIQFVEATPDIILPPEKQSFVLTKLTNDSDWVVGRAGMRYRDLIPDRQGGRFIASHIQIPDGGPVPDYVHFHRIRFQLIFCYKGWVKVVYEDQGEPFILEAGDCVLQPPLIRHRVLESSAALEVIEIGCPAEHETFADSSMVLPTAEINPERDFSGQKFVRHIAKNAVWKDWRIDGFESRDSGIGNATAGLAGVNVVRPLTPTLNPESLTVISHQQEFLFLFVLTGALTIDCENIGVKKLNPGDSCVIPKKMKHCLTETSTDLEFIEIRMLNKFETTQHTGIS